jgi:hypothetical protein
MNEARPGVQPQYVEVRGGDGRLLFRFDPARYLIEIKPHGGRVQVVDLLSIGQECESLVFMSLDGDRGTGQ